jgi:DNA-directed RNA polymerase subunit beta
MNRPIFVHNFPDFLEIQRSSYFWFLIHGISQELKHFPLFFEDKHISYKVYPQQFYFKLPLKTPSIVKLEDLTYTLEVYLPFEVTKKKKKDLPNGEEKVERKNLCIAEIPLMTDDATFIINGSERVVINQMARSPGIFFQRETDDEGNKVYAASIVSETGNWFKLEYRDQFLKKKDENESIESTLDSIDESKNIEFNEEDFSGNIDSEINFQLDETGEKNTFLQESLEEIDFQTRFRITLDNGYELPLSCLLLAFNLNSQSLSQRLKHLEYIDELLLDLDKEFDYLQGILTIYECFLDEDSLINVENKEDLASLFFNSSKYFSLGKIGRYKLNQKLNLNIPKSITHLTPNDLIAVIDAVLDLKNYRQLTDEVDDLSNKKVRSTGDILQGVFKLGVQRLERHISETIENEKLGKLDPEELIDPRFMVLAFKEFFSSSELSQFLDDVNPLAEITHKRRITVLGTEGMNQDNTTLEVRDIHPSHYGRLCPVETPEGQNAGLVTSLASCASINTFGFLESPFFICRDGKAFINHEFIYMDAGLESKVPTATSDILLDINHFINVEKVPVKYKNNFYLVQSKAIEFMSISPIQLFSIATSLVPFLEHDDANRVLMGANMQRQAVPLLYTQKPIVGTGLELPIAYDSGMVIKNYAEGFVEHSSSEKITIVSKKKPQQKITYHLQKYLRTNSDTCINQRPLVWIGEKVFSGQILADGPAINGGELALGRNLVVAYMTWEGYNFEDAIIVSERIVSDDLLTSVHIEEYETELYETPLGQERLTRNISTVSKHSRRHLEKNGLVSEGAFVKSGDILVGKVTPKEEEQSPESKLLKAIFGRDIIYRYTDSSLRVTNCSEGRVIDIRILPKTQLTEGDDNENAVCVLIRIYVAQIRKLQTGDKIAGRHGNKGIVSKILPLHDMPYLPDGTPVDIILNPLGVPSRMNVGQLFECLLGLAGDKLSRRYKVVPFDETFGKEASRILVNQKLKEASLKSSSNWVFNEYAPGKMLLTDGRTGEKFDNPILVGKSYILKLLHLVEDKIHARATGPYSLITQQPLGGRSQKGGQRFGEMEVWALEAYGAAYTLQEILTLKSDDIDGRNNSFDSILQGRMVSIPRVPEAFNVLTKELRALGFDLTTSKLHLDPYETKKKLIEKKDMLSIFEKELQIQSQVNYLTPRARILSQTSLAELQTKLFYEKEKKVVNNLIENDTLLNELYSFMIDKYK